MKAFQAASQSFKRLNPGLADKNDSTGDVDRFLGNPRIFRSKTEAEFALILEAQKQRNDILRYEYEGITLRWAGIRYTPDFVVFDDEYLHGDKGSSAIIKLIEVKGPLSLAANIYARSIERFKHARTYWPEFQFELHQKTKQGWKRIY